MTRRNITESDYRYYMQHGTFPPDLLEDEGEDEVAAPVVAQPPKKGRKAPPKK